MHFISMCWDVIIRHICGNSHSTHVPVPEGNGWCLQDGKLVIEYSTNQPAPMALVELVRCGARHRVPEQPVLVERPICRVLQHANVCMMESNAKIHILVKGMDRIQKRMTIIIIQMISEIHRVAPGDKLCTSDSWHDIFIFIYLYYLYVCLGFLNIKVKCRMIPKYY